MYTENCIKSTTDRNYKGYINTTKRGYICSYWNTTKYHNEEQNYCRTPSGDPDNDGGPWCYVSDHIVYWDRCNIPVCPGE